jgi:hypothetical protein
VEDGTVKMEYKQTEEMAADIFTKPVNSDILRKHQTTIFGT